MEMRRRELALRRVLLSVAAFALFLPLFLCGCSAPQEDAKAQPTPDPAKMREFRRTQAARP